MLNIIFGWPDTFDQLSLSTESCLPAKLYRLQQFSRSEAFILSKACLTNDDIFLLCLISLCRKKYDSFLDLIAKYESRVGHDSPQYLFLIPSITCFLAEIPKIFPLVDLLTTHRHSYWPLCLVLSAFNLHLNKLDQSRIFSLKYPLLITLVLKLRA